MTRPKNRHEPDPEALERQRRALELKIAGATYREIAAALGYRDGSAAYKAVQAGKRLGFVEPAAELRQLESDRLDRLQRAVWTNAVKGDLPAVNAALKISDQRAKLLGLNAPQRTDVTIKLDDQLAAQVIAVLQAVLGDPLLALTPDQRIVAGEIVPRHLRAVGAATETALKERKHRVEDAVASAKAAVEEGIVSGGGTALVQAAKVLDSTVLTRAAEMWALSAANRWSTPGALARALDPDTRQTRALDLIDAALVDVAEGRCDRLIISMPPQEGKSSRVTTVGALWFLLRKRHWRIAIASYSEGLAVTFGRLIRNYIADHQGRDGTLDIGVRIAADNGAVTDWTLAGNRGGIRSVGIGTGLTGRPVDCLIIDDPIKDREQADSETYRERAKNWWRTVGSTRLAPGAPVILILTRWHHDDLAGYLLGQPDKDRWRVINIPAQAEHRPDAGESDILGREPGEYMDSARIDERTGLARSSQQWEQTKIQVGPETWAALYQGSPTATTGNILPRDKWRQYDTPLWIEDADGRRFIPGLQAEDAEMIQSWDFTFKDTAASDYVVGQVWLRRGIDAYLLEQVRARMDFTASCQAMLTLSARWPQAIAKLVEDKANGPAILNALRSQVGGLIPVEPEGSKVARARAISPLQQAGNLWLPSPMLAPWVGDFIEEAAQFPHGKNDDQVDGASQAVHRLLLVPILAGQTLYPEDVLGDGVELDWVADLDY